MSFYGLPEDDLISSFPNHADLSSQILFLFFFCICTNIFYSITQERNPQVPLSPPCFSTLFIIRSYVSISTQAIHASFILSVTSLTFTPFLRLVLLLLIVLSLHRVSIMKYRLDYPLLC